MARDVFISHSSKDAAPAHELADFLKGRGHTVWIAPEDIPYGDWAAQIVDAIDGSRVVVVLLSAAANASRHVPREISLATARSKALLPIRVEHVEPAGALEFQLALVQRIDAFPPLVQHLPAIADRLGVMLGEGEATGAATPIAREPVRRRRVTTPIAGALAGLAAVVLISAAVLLARPPGQPAASPSPTGPSASPAGAVTLTRVSFDAAVHGEGTYANLLVGRDSVLFIGRVIDSSSASRYHLAVAQLTAETDAGGLQSGHWQADWNPYESHSSWQAIIAPYSAGATDVVEDLRRNGAASEFALAASEPQTLP